MAAGDSSCRRGSLVLEAWQLRRHSDSLEYTRVGHQHHKDPRRNATRATNSRSTTHLGIGDAWMDDASRASPRGAGGLDVHTRLPSSGCVHHLGAESRISSQFLIAPGPAMRTQLSMSVHPAESVACADRVERLPSTRCLRRRRANSGVQHSPLEQSDRMNEPDRTSPMSFSTFVRSAILYSQRSMPTPFSWSTVGHRRPTAQRRTSSPGPPRPAATNHRSSPGSSHCPHHSEERDQGRSR